MATSTALVPKQLELFENPKRTKQARVRIVTGNATAVTASSGRIQITNQSLTALTVEGV